jgi:hypothetical protein
MEALADVKDAEIDLSFRFVPRRAFFFVSLLDRGHCCTLFGSSSGKQTLAVSSLLLFYLFDWLLHRQDLAGRDCHFKSDMFRTKYPADSVQPAQFGLLLFTLSRRRRRGTKPSSCLRTCLLILIEKNCWRVSAGLQFFVVPLDTRLVEQPELNSGKCHGEIWNRQAVDWQSLADWDANLWLQRCG